MNNFGTLLNNVIVKPRNKLSCTFSQLFSMYSSINPLQVFRQLSRVTELHKNVTSSPEFEQLQLDFGDACDRLTEELRDLERHSNTAVLHLVVGVFKETTEPLSRLLQASLSTSQVRDTCMCQQVTSFTSLVTPLT